MADRFLLCKIETPFGKAFEDSVKMVIAKTSDGEVGILPLHVPYIGKLSIGELRVKYEGDRQEVFAVNGGYIRVAEDVVVITAESAEKAEYIDVARAEAAKIRAEKDLMDANRQDDVGFTAYSKDLERAINRISIAGRLSKR